MNWTFLSLQKTATRLRSAKSEFDVSDQVVTRVVASLESAAVPQVRRSRVRVATTIGVAAVVLFALGFVPVPRSGGKGALTRAMAAMESAPSVFIDKCDRDPNGSVYEMREWRAAGGL